MSFQPRNDVRLANHCAQLRYYVICWRHFGISLNSFWVESNIEKVPRGTQCESRERYGKFGKIGINNWIISKSNKGGRNQVSGMVSVPFWHLTPVANTPWKPLVIRWRSGSVSKSWNWWKVWSVWKSLWLVKSQNVVSHSWEGDFILLNKFPVSCIKLPESRCAAFHEVRWWSRNDALWGVLDFKLSRNIWPRYISNYWLLTDNHRCTCKWDWTEMLTFSFPFLKMKVFWIILRSIVKALPKHDVYKNPRIVKWRHHYVITVPPCCCRYRLFVL